MPIITMREAIRQAMDEEMSRDENIILMGEEVAQYNGAYKVSQGLYDKFGEKRVIDTPITESGFAGVGIGAAMAGLRPIVEFMTFNFALQAFDQIVNNAAKMRYMSGGQFKVPIVFRGPNGPAEYLASQHSQATQTFFAHVPGLKVVAPATPYDAKGLLKTAIRDDNPVIFLEGELMYSWEGEVPEEEYTIEFGKSDIKREGKDVTIITYSKPLKLVLESAKELEKDGIDVEVLDLRSIRPLDEETILNSVKKTNRCVIVDESWPFVSVASHVGWLISNKAFDYLDAPVELVTNEDVPMPYNHKLELAAQPSVDKIIKAVKKVLYI
ncbi:pyruvate dehydrogenase E1 component beta subunit [Marinitoga hydrogenitolerans DSM 16785]|uniref:Pyruvate dehydrogenase E1 component beta subunit n=1 Tax=Marinitoga hydrogenitolerans (strain DSM 16785 / JCM 12826 / AT1271) TaxID=1122195 RepID=A0A1M4WRN6_MARH1|nr:pyruvate dehydrogenase complex E1 component subunit beta [Marinitoga hydrogenitolerans]SHE83817.1 pyruvate dehydrogenase E1 component beta subunit [Marinitoga hydrogenitolerans DSM 16785]